jgi:hypothetical protein
MVATMRRRTMNRKTYKATVERGERYWLLTVGGVGMTQARSLREVPEMLQDLVATVLDVAPDSFTVEWSISPHQLVSSA